MSLNKTISLAIALLVAFLDIDAASEITFGACYVGEWGIEKTSKLGDTIWIE